MWTTFVSKVFLLSCLSFILSAITHNWYNFRYIPHHLPLIPPVLHVRVYMCVYLYLRAYVRIYVWLQFLLVYISVCCYLLLFVWVPICVRPDCTVSPPFPPPPTQYTKFSRTIASQKTKIEVFWDLTPWRLLNVTTVGRMVLSSFSGSINPVDTA